MTLFLRPLTVAAFTLTLLSGCAGMSKLVEKLPAGTAFQSSQVGVQFSPESMTPLNFGSSFVAFQLPPEPGVATINRGNFRAGLRGVENTSTVTFGPVGEQIQAAGGPDALETLLQSRLGSSSQATDDQNPPQ